MDQIVHDIGAEPVFPAQNGLSCDGRTQNSLRLSNPANVQLSFNTKGAFCFESSLTVSIHCLPVKPFVLRSSHQSLSPVAIYEFMSFSVSMIYICKLKSTKSACLHSQPRYATVIWGKGWHTGEIPSVRGKKDDDTFFFMMP